MIIDSGSKLLIVIVVLLLILLGLAAFLFYLERRLTCSERKIRELEKKDLEKKDLEKWRLGEGEKKISRLAD